MNYELAWSSFTKFGIFKFINSIGLFSISIIVGIVINDSFPNLTVYLLLILLEKVGAEFERESLNG